MRQSEMFAPDSDWENNACMNFGRDSWRGYAIGYRRAGQILTQHVLDTSNDQDTLVYPIVFLSRHFLELTLKRSILFASMFLDREAKLPTHHRIDALWSQLKPLLVEMMSDEDSLYDLSDIEVVIRELAALDPGSFSFRYSVDKKGVSTLPNDLKYVNLRLFADKFEPAADDIETLEGWIEDRLSFKREHEGEYC